jgi:phenylacetate-CoA ligase
MFAGEAIEWLSRLPATWAGAWQSRAALERAAHRRFERLVRHAVAHSPYYAAHYRRHGMSGADLTGNAPLVPQRFAPVHKATLMRHFDQWVTDPQVHYDDARAFLTDPQRIGAYYLGRYAVWKSSGTTGEPGIFLHSRDALALYDALAATRFDHGGLIMASALQRPWSCIGPYVLIAATGQHFAGVSAWERLRRVNPWWQARTHVLSVLSPVHEWVRDLNLLQPSILSSYATVLTTLADEQIAHRLKLRPALCWSGGECLTAEARRHIEGAFGCPVVNDYGASEAFSVAFECPHGWLHVNSDWIVLEPVDSHGHAAPPGTRSHSTLLTNLANWVQPLIRYDLGDSITVNPDPCPCGNPLPAIRVEGRRDDAIRLRTARGDTVTVCPMALSTIVEEAAGIHRFQVVQRADRQIAVRFEPAGADSPSHQWQRIETALRHFLATQGVPGVDVQWDRSPLARNAVSGKLRQVVALQKPPQGLSGCGSA